MTEASGLKLNADKTELIQKGGDSSYDVSYMGGRTKVLPTSIIKINGLYLSYEVDKANELNLDKIFTSMEKQFRMWKNMYLSILGKILIYKTFGLSQILFIASTILIPIKMEKKLTELIYRFIWNSNFENAKAPDRIKRSILSTPLNKLGFGMLDFREVVKSIRIKTYARLISTDSHPINQMLRNSLTKSIVNIEVIHSINPVLDATITYLNKAWKHNIKTCNDEQRNILYSIIMEEYIGNVLIKRFRNKRQGLYHRHDKIGEVLNLNPQNTVIKKIDRSIQQFILGGGSCVSITNYKYILPSNSKIIITNILSSKLIRTMNTPQDILTPKVLENTSMEGLQKLGKLIKSITNSKLKSIILRALHGDIYCGTRLKKFGMTTSDECVRCKTPETIKHLLLECHYVKRTWELCSKFTGIQPTSINEVLGCHDFHDKTTLTMHTEIIRRLLAIDRPVTNQNKLIESVIDRLSVVEKGISKHTLKNFKLQLKNLYPVNDSGTAFS